MKGALLIGARYKAALDEALKMHGFSPFYLPENPFLDARLSHHADLSVVKLGKGTIVAAQHLCDMPGFCDLVLGSGYELVFAENRQGATYPEDTGLCACVSGDIIFCRKKSTDPAVLNHHKGNVVNVQQGYAKCSCCALPGGAIITSDSGIFSAAELAGVCSLKILPGGIELSGFDAGFIGGASFCSEGVLYLTGSLDAHPSKLELCGFLKEQGVALCALTAEPIFDIGSAIVL